jgi:FkbM family methyltransferase
MKSFKTLSAVLLPMVFMGLTIVHCSGKDPACDCPRDQFDGGVYYSQYYEDYILAYVFKETGTGYYIDVGANDPDTCNVAKYFYEHGWRGVNIEPNVDLFKRIVKTRPRDSNYNYGISASEGSMTFYQHIDGLMGLSTFDKAIADREKRENNAHFKEIEVPMTTLSAIAAKANLPEISFINIDVEGYEKQVLESFDLRRFKPAVFCIESTNPLTSIPSYKPWENLLLGNGYRFAMSDGLNRYYVQNDHSKLLPRFTCMDVCVKKSKRRRNIESFQKGIVRKLYKAYHLMLHKN